MILSLDEAISVIEANVIYACEKAKVDSATIELVSDALDTIISLAEQRAEQTEPQKDCKKCKNYDRCKNNHWKCCVYQPKDEPQICDTCRYYNSDIPCGSTPSACKEADTFAEEFVQGMKNLRMVAKTKQSNSEKPNNCETCKFELYWPEMCDGCCEWDSHYEPKDKPQTDIHDLTDCDFCKDRNCKDCEGGTDEPQTELVNDSQILVKDLVDDEFNPYDEECMRCKHLKLKCEFVPSYCKYESRNEQSGKE